MSDNVKEITSANFNQEVLESDLPVLIDFWAEWCGPCKSMLPLLDELSKEYEGKVKVCKMDIDNNPDTPAKYGIRSIPTIKVFKKGDIAGSETGTTSKTALNELIQSSL